MIMTMGLVVSKIGRGERSRGQVAMKQKSITRLTCYLGLYVAYLARFWA